MPAIRGAGSTKRWRARAIVLAVTLLALATSFCLFDQDAHDGGGHTAPPDFCHGMLVGSLVVILLAGLLSLGFAVGPAALVAHAIAPRIPDPPPRSARVR